ncbi:MAG: phosphodiester glycosidase family protein [Nevskia sp.]|nr:phosphodiester glycosidase family protein [Nevskia sp.]
MKLRSTFAACAAAFASLLPLQAAAVDCYRMGQGDVRASVCRVDLRRDRLQLFLRDDRGRILGGFAELEQWLGSQGRTLQFAMNAGMYRPDYTPSGLFVADGVQQRPLVTAAGHGNFFLKPNGVFLLTASGARIVETSEYPQLRERVLLATQSGPLLLHAGRIHPAFRENSDSRLIRNGVGVPAQDQALFVISDTPVNFHQFATLFRDGLHCPDALYLDGSVSSLYAPQLGRSDRLVPLGPLIGVAAPRP